ncbi:MAG TPA: ShlB/FhaC/HecB family hemolysin secretion/activation protein [Rhodocyclaceae bacterium]|nr:ShlB/FhaC/HecB family hemolysin secretion/activation protein [Rhodocyclaceae bacterium]
MNGYSALSPNKHPCTTVKNIASRRKTTLALGLLAALTSTLLTDVARAQTSPADTAQRIQREEQERQRQQMERDQRRLPAPKGSESSAPAPKAEETDTVCRDVHEIAITGAANLPQSERTVLTKPYLERCLYVRDIEKLLADITNYYIKHGYVTTRVYVPKQDLSKGKLEIMVVEGVVEKISIIDGDKKTVSVGNVMPGAQGKLLNMRDLEQGLDQINRLQSNNATFEIRPGDAAGSSDVVIHNTASSPVHADVRWDNEGAEATGQNEVGASGSIDNVFGFDDYISVTHMQSVPAREETKLSKTDSAAYSLPLGYSTLSLAASKSRYVSQIDTDSGSSLKSSGTSAINSVKLDNVVYRSSTDRATLSGTLTTKDTRNFLDDQLLSVSSRKLTIFDLDSDYTTGFHGSVVSIDLGLSRGLHTLGAMEDPDFLPREAPRAQFLKYKYGYSIAVPFEVEGVDSSFSSVLVGQQSQRALYGSEQILIGSIYTVRGFVDNSLMGDNGFYVRNDLAANVPVRWFKDYPMIVRPYIGLDLGRTSMRYGGTDAPAGYLSGMAVGLSISGKYLSLDIFNGRPLTKPSFMTRESDATFFVLTLATS